MALRHPYAERIHVTSNQRAATVAALAVALLGVCGPVQAQSHAPLSATAPDAGVGAAAGSSGPAWEQSVVQVGPHGVFWQRTASGFAFDGRAYFGQDTLDVTHERADYRQSRSHS